MSTDIKNTCTNQSSAGDACGACTECEGMGRQLEAQTTTPSDRSADTYAPVTRVAKGVYAVDGTDLHIVLVAHADYGDGYGAVRHWVIVDQTNPRHCSDPFNTLADARFALGHHVAT